MSRILFWQIAAYSIFLQHGAFVASENISGCEIAINDQFCFLNCEFSNIGQNVDVSHFARESTEMNNIIDDPFYPAN